MLRTIDEEIKILEKAMGRSVNPRCYFIRVYNTWRLLTTEEYDYIHKVYDDADDHFIWWTLDYSDYKKLVDKKSIEEGDFAAFYFLSFRNAERRLDDIRGLAATMYERAIQDTKFN